MFRLLVCDRKLDDIPPSSKAHDELPLIFESASSIRLFRRPYDEQTRCNTVAALALPTTASNIAELFKFMEFPGDSASSSCGSTLSACTAVNVLKLHHSEFNDTVSSTGMAVFQFGSSEAAAAFFHQNHGRQVTFSTHKESEWPKVHTLQLVVIDGLVDDSTASTADGASNSIASLLSLPLSPGAPTPSASATAPPAPPSDAGCGSEAESRAPVVESKEDWVELPSCPACLDRLDGSVSGVSGHGVCSHQSLMVDSQRCSCWATLDLSLCPACSALQAYSQDGGGGANSNANRGLAAAAAEDDQSSVGEGGSSSSSSSSSSSVTAQEERTDATTTSATTSDLTGHHQPHKGVECAVCGAVSRLWTCLVCGFVGCGRYTAEHSLRHSRASGHRWAMELGSRRVWDYFEDTYAHRLPGVHAQSHQASFPLSGARGDVRDLASGGRSLDKGAKAAGHMMQELNGFASGDFGDQEVAVKLGALALEYESLLTTQLSEQRRYFERLLAKEEAAGLAAAAEAGASSSQLSEIEALRHSCEELEAEHALVAEALRHEEAVLKESRNKQASLLAQQRATEREARRSQATVAVEQRQIEDAVAELQQQVTELTFYARTVKEVGASPNKAEIQEGQVLVANDKNNNNASRGKGNNRNGRKSGGGRRH